MTEGHSLEEGYDMCLNKELWALEEGMTDSHGAPAKTSEKAILKGSENSAN